MVADDSHDEKTQSFIALTSGTSVFHYKIIEKIGAGGMGEVYLALDTRLGRKVALKFLPPHLCQDNDCRKRFKREAQAAAGLDHPNIAAIYEVGEHQGRPFYAMQIVEGQSLKDVISGKDLSVERILEIAIQVCEGLQAAHDKGIIHRDIKPSNILLDGHGRVRIVDFGLAAIRGSEHLTRTGSTLGTIGYMSPEQVRGEKIDHRSDLFSLGVVLYELITKQNPFRRESEAATLKAVSDDTPHPVARYRANVTEGIQGIIDKALEKDVRTRFQHADGMLADLMRIRRDSDSALPTRAAAPKRMRWLRFAMPIVMVIVAVVVLVLKPWQIAISPTQDAIAAEKRLAILYFENLSDLGDSLRIGEIITNLLITDLSESKYISVVSSQRLYDILKQLGLEGERRIDRDVATQVADRANARLMLLGSVVRAEPAYLLTAQLVDVSTGDILSSQRIEGQPGTDVFPLIDSLTVAIKSDLSLPMESISEVDPAIADVTTSSEDAYRYFVKANEYSDKLYRAEAELYYRKAIEEDSNFVPALLKIYGGYASHKERAVIWPKIMQNYHNLSRKNKFEVDRIEAYFIDHDLDRTVEIQKSLLEEFPDDRGEWMNLGNLQWDLLRDYKGAKDTYYKVLQLEPNSYWSYNMLAYAYDALGLYDSAVWAANKGVELRGSEDANPHDTRADIFSFYGQLDEAIQSYEKAAAIRPDFTGLDKLAFKYLYIGETAAADSLLRFIAADDYWEDRAQGRRSQASMALYQGKFQLALERLELAEGALEAEGHAVSIFMVDVLIEQAGIYAFLNRDISQQFRKLAAADMIMSQMGGPDSMMWRFASSGIRAVCLARQRDSVGIDSLRHALSKSPDKIDPQHTEWLNFARGLLEYETGNVTQAISHFSALDQSKSNFLSRFWLARSYLAAGELGDAVETFQRALMRYDRSRDKWPIYAATVHYYVGQAYEQSGWDRKAEAQYSKFLEVWKNADPGIKEIEDAKVRLARVQSS